MQTKGCVLRHYLVRYGHFAHRTVLHGYNDGDYTLFKAVPISDFVRSSDPIAVLGSVNKMTFLTEEEKECVVLLHNP